jgi:hypothetical protein
MKTGTAAGCSSQTISGMNRGHPFLTGKSVRHQYLIFYWSPVKIKNSGVKLEEFILFTKTNFVLHKKIIQIN